MANEVISDTADPEQGDSDRKTTVLRHFLRGMFNQNVDRQLLTNRRLDRAESVKQILSKRHTDVIQKTVELAAAQNLPVEANFEHRHEIKGESAAAPANDKPQSTAGKTSKVVTKAQKQRAQRAAQKFVEPITTQALVSVNQARSKPLATNVGYKNPSNYDYRPVLLRSVLAATVVAAAIVVIYVVR